MTRPAIYEPAITQWVVDGRDAVQALQDVNTNNDTLEKQLSVGREAAQMRRIELGRILIRVRESMPKRGDKEGGWRLYLDAIELGPTSAWRYMKEAGAVFQLGEVERMGAQPCEVTTPPQDDLPPHTDDDAPPEAAPPPPKTNRDGWCTPEPIAKALPKKLALDPCSNPRSIVRAKTKYMLEAGQNGLELPWFGLVFVNGPYSDLLPFAEKLEAERKEVVGAGFLVNADNSPAWWHLLTKHLHLRLDFNERQEFIPPPGVEPSKNDRPQTLLMDAAFWAACDQRALLSMGTLWQQLAA